MKKIITLGAVLGATPLLAFAANDLFGVLTVGNQLLNTITQVLMAFAVVYFIFNVVKYIMGSDEEAKKKSRGGIINGLIGLFVIIAFWGIIGVVMNTVGVGPTKLNSNSIPCVPGPGVYCN